MQVILLKDVKGTGKKGDVCKVSDGYGANYLIPNKLAVMANNSNLNENKQAKASAQHKQEVEKGEAMLLKNQLEGITVTLKVRCGENGKTFGAVTSKEICEELKKLGLEVDKRKVNIDQIKQIGTYTATAKLYQDVVAKFIVEVQAQKENKIYKYITKNFTPR